MKETPKVEEAPKATLTPAKEKSATENQNTRAKQSKNGDLFSQLTAAKEKGTAEFKNKDFYGAIAGYTKGIDLYHKAGKPKAKDTDLLVG